MLHQTNDVSKRQRVELSRELSTELNSGIIKFMVKYLLIALVAIIIGSFGFIAYKAKTDLQEAGVEIKPFEKLGSNNDEEETANIRQGDPLGKPINILLLGIDRRSRAESAYRTDIMILMSANPDTNRVTLASLPRDLWHKNGRLNAVYIQYGWEELQNAVETITGERPERYILTDFKDFSWIVDAMGGVPVEVDTTFTDSSYPVDETFGYQTVSFTAGPELLTGDRALIFSRSRKGDYDNGDWGRMKRQHKILNGMLDAVVQPKSIFNPMVVEEAYKTVTTGKMDTNLSVADAKYLWDFYKDKDLYEIHSLFLDMDYLYTPPMEEYGGAWVLAPVGGSYSRFQNDLKTKLYAQEDFVSAPESSEVTAL